MNYFIADDLMCINVTVIDIIQPVHVVFQNIFLSIAETTQSVFGFFVSSFKSLHCECSHTTSIFVKSCSCYLWHTKSQNMHVESFISSWICFVFCEITQVRQCFGVLKICIQEFNNLWSASDEAQQLTSNERGEFLFKIPTQNMIVTPKLKKKI